MSKGKLKKISIFTDGACSGNPGPGGYGIILRYNDHEKEISGGEPHTTNNRMELIAVIVALRSVKEPCEVILTTDSEYVKKGITEWISSWKERGWKNANKKPIANRDLWEELDEAQEKHRIHWKWVKGHSDHPENERCDELARRAIKDFQEMGYYQ